MIDEEIMNKQKTWRIVYKQKSAGQQCAGSEDDVVVLTATEKILTLPRVFAL